MELYVGVVRLVDILFPLAGVVCFGYFYGRKYSPNMGVPNRLNMDIFLPALVFYVMSGKSFELQQYASLAIGGFLVLTICGTLAWLVSGSIGISPKTLVPPMMFNNAGNIGIPLAVLAWGESALAPAVVLFMVENTMHFAVGGRLLDENMRLATLWRIPVILAAIIGGFVAVTELSVWAPLLTATKMLGEISVPLLLFSLGVRMTGINFRDWRVSVGSAVIRPLIGILIAAGVVLLLELKGNEASMLLVFGALPPAVLNFLFAERYSQEPERVASIVLVGNLFSVIFLGVALAAVL